MSEITERSERPLEHAKQVLVQHILDGLYMIGDRLPPERELAAQLGITRPTLREAIRHLEQEGWLLVQHGKPTTVRDFWREGGLTVLSRVIHHQGFIKPGFVTNLLDFRLLVAPTYTRDAVEYGRSTVLARLKQMPAVDAAPEVFASFDWMLQRDLTIASANVIFPRILNGFDQFYEQLAIIYFQPEDARATSHAYYLALADAAAQGDSERAYALTHAVMEASIQYWRTATANISRIALNIPPTEKSVKPEKSEKPEKPERTP